MRLILPVVAVGALALAAGEASAQSAAPAPQTSIVTPASLFTADDLLLLEVSVDNQVVTDALGAYSSRAGVYVPLGEFARLFDLAIVVKPPEGIAEGWVLTPDRTLSLDLQTGVARVGARGVMFNEAQAVLFENEIYLRTDLLEQLLPVRLKADIPSLALIVTPMEPMPFQQRLDRERRRAGLGREGGTDAVLTVETPYAAFTPPTVDINLQTEGSTRQTADMTRYDLRLGGDLLYGGFQLFAGSDEEAELDNVRMIWERKDPDGRDAGPMGLRRTSLGDVFTPNLALGARSAGGRGVFLSTEPLEQASVFNTIDLRGELPLGYEVELYVNEVLRQSQAFANQGQYEFLKVPLAYGLNVIRLVFYGPRGERREEVSRVNVGGGQLSKGQAIFSFGAVEQGRPIVDLRGADPAIILAEPGFGKARIAANAAYGLTQGLTVSAGLAQYAPRLDDERQMATAGLRTSLGGLAIQADVAADDQSGSAAALGLAGRPMGVSLVARHAEYQGGFFDETQPRGAGGQIPLKRSTEARADLNVRAFGRSVPLALQAGYDELVDGATFLTGGARVSTMISDYFMSSSWSYDRSETPLGGSFERFGGSVDFAGRLDSGWQVRAAMAYDIVPEPRLLTAGLTLDKDFGERSALRLGVFHAFGDEPSTTFVAASTWRMRHLDLALSSAYTTDTDEFRFGLQLSIGFIFDPLRSAYRPVRPGAAAGGAVAVRAFVDQDGDGRLGLGERPQAGVFIGAPDRGGSTDVVGQILVTALGDSAYARVPVKLESIDDPYLAPPPAVIQVEPRPGRVTVVDYPLHTTGEVMLKMQLRGADGGLRGLSAVQVELVSASGQVAGQGRSEYDGAVILDGLAPGAYAVRINPDQAARLGLVLAEAPQVTIPAAGGFVGEVQAIVSVKP